MRGPSGIVARLRLVPLGVQHPSGKMSSVSHADCPSSPADFAAAAKGKGYVVHADLKAMFFKLGMEMTDYDVETMMDALGVESGRINYEQWCRLVDDQADDQASPPSTIEAGAFEAGTGETGSVVYEGAVEKKGYLRKNWKHRCFVLQIPIGSGGDGDVGPDSRSVCCCLVLHLACTPAAFPSL